MKGELHRLSTPRTAGLWAGFPHIARAFLHVDDERRMNRSLLSAVVTFRESNRGYGCGHFQTQQQRLMYDRVYQVRAVPENSLLQLLPLAPTRRVCHGGKNVHTAQHTLPPNPMQRVSFPPERRVCPKHTYTP